MTDKLERGLCTAHGCRHFVRDGQGEQVVIDGTLERYCDRHRLEYWRSRIDEKGAEGLVVGACLLAAVLLIVTSAMLGF